MSGSTCPRCGRDRGWALTQCSPRDHESCLGFLRERAERESQRLRAELADAKAEVERLRAMFGDVNADQDAYIAEREADELRRLAWSWCIEAAFWHRSWQAECSAIRAMLAAKKEPLPCDEPPSAFDAMAEQAGPLPTAVLADSPDVEPIESLGPVPADVPGSLRSRVEWLVRDAVRRGAKLEGDDR